MTDPTTTSVSLAPVANTFDFREKALYALERLRAFPKPKVIASFFRHPHCRYILNADAAAWRYLRGG